MKTSLFIVGFLVFCAGWYFYNEMNTTSLFIVAFLLFYVWYVYNEIKLAKKKRQQLKCKNYVVTARLKKEENGRWICKFFQYGDHIGYFEEKPSSERVKAVVIDYDNKVKMYKLQEYVED